VGFSLKLFACWLSKFCPFFIPRMTLCESALILLRLSISVKSAKNLT
jgi:hypothetical protein